MKRILTVIILTLFIASSALANKTPTPTPRPPWVPICIPGGPKCGPYPPPSWHSGLPQSVRK